MTLEEQRIAIAEACGHKETEHFEGFGWCSRDKDGRACITVPNYLSDLNAMHEAEKVLTINQLLDYLNWLSVNVNPGNDDLAFSWVRVHATAAHRAEAFLRTLKLWK